MGFGVWVWVCSRTRVCACASCVYVGKGLMGSGSIPLLQWPVICCPQR